MILFLAGFLTAGLVGGGMVLFVAGSELRRRGPR